MFSHTFSVTAVGDRNPLRRNKGACHSQLMTDDVTKLG